MTVPTISQLSDQIMSDVEGVVGVTIPLLAKAVIRVLAKALAAVQYLAYRYIAWTLKQVFTATADAAQLLIRGAQYGMSPNGAEATVLAATATGTVGATIPAATLWTAAGQVCTQLADAVIGGSGAAISVQANIAGAAANVPDGTILSIGSSVVGADGSATVTSTVTSGVDAEDIETFRGRVEQRERNKPQGGSAADFVIWALEVPGVIKAFAYRPTPGFVVVNPLVALDSMRLPSTTKITEVAAYVGDTHRRPFNVNVLVQAMTERIIALSITWGGSSQVKAIIEADIATYLYGRFPMQYPDEAGPTNEIGIADIYAICVADGARPSAITMTVDGNPATSYSLQDGELAVKGAVSWA